MSQEKKLAKTPIRNDQDEPIGMRFKFRGIDEPLIVLFTDLTPAMLLECTAHGISQKVGDGCSGEKEPDLAMAMCEVIADSIKGGDWNQKGPGTGGDFIHAMSDLSKQSRDAVRAMLDEATEANVKTWKADKAIKARMAEIKLERAQREAKGAEDKGTDFLALFPTT